MKHSQERKCKMNEVTLIVPPCSYRATDSSPHMAKMVSTERKEISERESRKRTYQTGRLQSSPFGGVCHPAEAHFRAGLLSGYFQPPRRAHHKLPVGKTRVNEVCLYGSLQFICESTFSNAGGHDAEPEKVGSTTEELLSSSLCTRLCIGLCKGSSVW